MTYELHHGDCLELLRLIPADSVDAIVTDPPYGLEFMGKAWDGADGFRRSLGEGVTSTPGIGERDTAWPSNQGWNGFRCANCGHLAHGGSPCSCDAPKFERADNRWHLFQQWTEAWATECLRVLKPGGHLLSFGGTRTYHRMTCAIEDAGFEIRDCLMWLYGSGFPKSMDVSKAIDKAAGAERTERGAPKAGHENFVGRDNMKALREGTMSQGGGFARPWMSDPEAVEAAHWDFLPATPEAERWQGWGTALKPACEPIVLARKPLIGTVAKNVLAHGTGALNIDASRIGNGAGSRDREAEPSQERRYADVGGTDFAAKPGVRGGGANGRWPANVLLDEEAAALLDEQTGALTSGSRKSGVHRLLGGDGRYGDSNEVPMPEVVGSTGGASRFFYVAKASKSERNRGLADKNDHPTVKPIALMEYLVRLITPPGGLVLDPFVGSGTTGIAARRLDFDFVGIDQDAHYLEIARQRIEAAA